MIGFMQLNDGQFSCGNASQIKALNENMIYSPTAESAYLIEKPEQFKQQP